MNHANIIADIVKLAAKLDNMGDYKTATQIDKIITKAFMPDSGPEPEIIYSRIDGRAKIHKGYNKLKEYVYKVNIDKIPKDAFIGPNMFVGLKEELEDPEWQKEQLIDMTLFNVFVIYAQINKLPLMFLDITQKPKEEELPPHERAEKAVEREIAKAIKSNDADEIEDERYGNREEYWENRALEIEESFYTSEDD